MKSSLLLKFTSLIIVLAAIVMRGQNSRFDTLWISIVAVALLWIMDAQTSAGPGSGWRWTQHLFNGSSMPTHGAMLVSASLLLVILPGAGEKTPAAEAKASTPALATRPMVKMPVSRPTLPSNPALLASKGATPAQQPALARSGPPMIPGIDPVTKRVTFGRSQMSDDGPTQAPILVAPSKKAAP